MEESVQLFDIKEYEAIENINPREVFGEDLKNLISTKRIASRVLFHRKNNGRPEVFFVRHNNGLILLPGGRVEIGDYNDWAQVLTPNETPRLDELLILAVEREMGEELPPDDPNMPKERRYIHDAFKGTLYQTSWQYNGSPAIDFVCPIGEQAPEFKIVNTFQDLISGDEIQGGFWMDPVRMFYSKDIPKNIRFVLKQAIESGLFN